MARELHPPSGGTQPPATAQLPNGEILHLTPLAHEIARRFRSEHPDEEARYGNAGYEWCVHDNLWLLSWAVEDKQVGGGHFAKNVRWLASLLRARDYPSAWLARDLEIAAAVVGEDDGARRELARTLLDGAAALSAREPGEHT